MSIKITIGKGEGPNFKLNVRKTLDGNLVIYDHPDIDIVVMPDKKKILVLTNDSLNASSKTYDVQNKLFKFLLKKGVVTPDSIHSGNVYGSMEGTYPELKEPKEDATATDFVLMACMDWVEQQRPEWLYDKEIKEREIDRMTDPPADETTPLNKVPHADKKGNNFPIGSKIGGAY
ncbi:MAG: hypothetical protein Q8P81_00630 [Nanoarchaeota archaeon]|nr:hypothetical protein [Nanoarchaeota archaeon]